MYLVCGYLSHSWGKLDFLVSSLTLPSKQGAGTEGLLLGKPSTTLLASLSSLVLRCVGDEDSKSKRLICMHVSLFYILLPCFVSILVPLITMTPLCLASLPLNPSSPATTMTAAAGKQVRDEGKFKVKFCFLVRSAGHVKDGMDKVEQHWKFRTKKVVMGERKAFLYWANTLY